MCEKPGPKPFKIAVPDEVLEDQRQRLRRSRWPDEVPGTDWQFGTSLPYMRELVDYWRNTYDWRANERLFNSFSQYQLQMGDVRLHYICQPGVGPEPLPLILIHGWPSPIYEFVKVIGPLTDPGEGRPQGTFMKSMNPF